MCVQRSSSHISSEQQRNLVLAREKKGLFTYHQQF